MRIFRILLRLQFFITGQMENAHLRSIGIERRGIVSRDNFFYFDVLEFMISIFSVNHRKCVFVHTQALNIRTEYSLD